VSDVAAQLAVAGKPVEVVAWRIYNVRTEDRAMPATAIREKTINLRATPAQKALIERAAEAAGETRTAFVLDASLQRAEAVLADRVHFELSPAQMERFTRALDAPVSDRVALRKLLARKPRWAR
jgi:uncharacterized protein (DUF1778 family)